MATFQFIRIKGFPRGHNRSKKSSTLNSVLSEGRRVPTFSRHVPAPDIRITCIDRHFESVSEYQRWIEMRMFNARNPLVVNGVTHYRGVRKDAVAIGTIIVSLPSKTSDTPSQRMDSFKKDASAWIKDYLNKKGMSLDYCVEHYDEEYPHLHFWFTPNDESLFGNVWFLGQIANPKLKERNQLRQQFFHDVGHKYFDKLQKDKDQQIKRQPSRYIAAQNRLPAGVPENEQPKTMLGFPVSDEQAGNQSFSDIQIEQSPHFQSVVKQLLASMLEHRRLASMLSDEEALEKIFTGSQLSASTIRWLMTAVLKERHDSDETTLQKKPRFRNR